MITANIQRSHYRTGLQGEKHQFFADESIGSNGTDTAPSPEELLDAALASCTAITLRMYADRKGWHLNSVSVYVEHQRDGSTTNFKRHIELEGQLTETQRQRLLAIAQGCPVSRILESKTTISSEINL